MLDELYGMEPFSSVVVLHFKQVPCYLICEVQLCIEGANAIFGKSVCYPETLMTPDEQVSVVFFCFKTSTQLSPFCHCCCRYHNRRILHSARCPTVSLWTSLSILL